jgi:hypothetical protein
MKFIIKNFYTKFGVKIFINKMVTVKELKVMAASLGIRNYSKMRKQQLIDAIDRIVPQRSSSRSRRSSLRPSQGAYVNQCLDWSMSDRNDEAKYLKVGLMKPSRQLCQELYQAQ